MPLSDRPLVLLVDDVDEAREMYGFVLESAGFSVIEAWDGVTALRLAAERRPAVIVMDLSLPRMDGWAATRALKSDPVTAGIPVVVLTAHALGTEEQRARDAGCDVYLTKPCLPLELVTHVRAVSAAPPDRRSERRLSAATKDGSGRRKNR